MGGRGVLEKGFLMTPSSRSSLLFPRKCVLSVKCTVICAAPAPMPKGIALRLQMHRQTRHKVEIHPLTRRRPAFPATKAADRCTFVHQILRPASAANCSSVSENC